MPFNLANKSIVVSKNNSGFKHVEMIYGAPFVNLLFISLLVVFFVICTFIYDNFITGRPFSQISNDISMGERQALKELSRNKSILKKSDKGSTTVLMSRQDTLNEGQVLLDDLNNYRPLEKPMVETTTKKAQQLIKSLLSEGHIDKMTAKWLSLTPDPPRIPVFYRLTKIHKLTLVGRPILSGCSGPTEKISAFVDHLIQPIVQQQASYLKDTTDFINFTERIKLPRSVILVSMDVTSLYTNIPQREGITTVCNAYEEFYQGNRPVPTGFLREMLSLILQENSLKFNGKDYLQTHGTTMGTGSICELQESCRPVNTFLKAL